LSFIDVGREFMIRVLVAAAGAVAAAAFMVGGAGSASSLGSGCIGHRPAYIEDVFEVQYDAGCSGHDEPELDPISSLPGSAQDLTWRFVLPTDGSVPVSAVGPTFWFGGAVTDPSPKDIFGQGFLEVQFYPDSLVRNCTPNGGFVVDHAPNTYTVCTPVWSIRATGQKPVYHEPAEFNAMLTTGAKHAPLVMHAGETIRLHFHLGAPGEGWHIDVLDETTGESGTVVLTSPYGPILPVFSTQTIGNSLNWSGVYDTPNSFVWEIGHTSPFTSPASQFCVPGQTICDSYNEASWLGFSPLKILSATFTSSDTPAEGWAVVSDYGGDAEVKQYCGSVGGPFCVYPWFTLGTDGTLRYGADYPGTADDFGKGSQFATITDCDSPFFGPDTLYCDNQIIP
jgi:hypothetical protein